MDPFPPQPDPEQPAPEQPAPAGGEPQTPASPASPFSAPPPPPPASTQISQPAPTQISQPAQTAYTPPADATQISQPAQTAYAPAGATQFSQPAATQFAGAAPTQMSQPQPTAYAQQPTAYGAPQQTAYAQQPPASPPAPPKKKRTGCIIAVVVVLLMCCIAGSIVGFIAWQDNQQRTKAETAVKAADTEYAKIEKSFSAITSLTADFKPGEGGGNVGEQTKKLADDATKKVDQAGKDIAAARKEIEPVKSTPIGVAYVKALDESDEALKAMKAELGYIGNIGGQAAIWVDAIALFNKGFTARNDAIENANGQAWDKAESKATEAAGLYKQAEDMFNKSHKMDPEAGLDAAAAFSAKRREEADLIRQMASDGRNGRTTSYNKNVERVNAMSNEISAMKEPAIFTDTTWVEKRLAKFTKDVEDHMNKAKTAFDEAHKALTDGKYK